MYYQACIRTFTIKVYGFLSVRESESAYDKSLIMPPLKHRTRFYDVFKGNKKETQSTDVLN